jgi:hypothetical protein
MLRFFISPHPTFKSYKDPDRERVEKSPYYWWWYALTLNTEYIELCRKVAGDILLTDAQTEKERKVREVYQDFGDVRYDGDRYKAFCDWWRARPHTGERRGEYLFAEPIYDSTVSVLDSLTDAERAMASADTLVLSVPLNRQRQHVDKAIDRLLKRHMNATKGRTVRNPNQSKARYQLSKAAVPSALKKTFTVYEEKLAAENNSLKITNIEIAFRAKIDSGTQKNNGDETFDNAAKNRILSVLVSRHIKRAKEIINNAGSGTFP